MCKGARPNWGCTPGRGEGNVCVRRHVPSGGVHQAAGRASCVQGHVPPGGVHQAAGRARFAHGHVPTPFIGPTFPEPSGFR